MDDLLLIYREEPVDGNLYDLISLPLRVEAHAQLRVPDPPGAGRPVGSLVGCPRGSAGRCQIEIFVNFVYFEFYLPTQLHNHLNNCFHD